MIEVNERIEVPSAPQVVWSLLSDPRAVVGCVPGAALGDFWGPVANETRAWLDHLAVGKPCALATAREARATLEVTLAIEHSAASGRPVNLPLAK